MSKTVKARRDYKFKPKDFAPGQFSFICETINFESTQEPFHGTPLVDTKASFKNTASYGDVLDIHTHVAEWRKKSFVQRYRIVRGDTLIMECEEVRIFAAWNNDGAPGIRAVAVPADIRAMCE